VYKWLISKEVYNLGQSMIENCDDWVQAYATFGNGKISIWTGNGLHFIDSYPETRMFSSCEKLYIKNCIKKSTLKKVLSNA
jgi:hypothetical protein